MEDALLDRGRADAEPEAVVLGVWDGAAAGRW